MKRAIFSLMAAMALVAVFAVPPAHANGGAQCKTMAIEVSGLPDVCPTGEVMEGKLWIWLADDGTRGPKLVGVRATAATPFGDVVIYTVNLQMAPGSERSLALPLPVEHQTPYGLYTLNFTVAVKGGDSLTVPHDVEVVPGK